jgi:nitrate reductase / nitrite oxidoreductase, alpha subunit
VGGPADRLPVGRAGPAGLPAAGARGFAGASWDEAVELAAAAHVHTIRTWGPDRIAGFSPIPAMSMVSHAAGARFRALIGAPMLSFYDWYADLPVASPQVFGDGPTCPSPVPGAVGAPTRQDAAGG